MGNIEIMRGDHKAAIDQFRKVVAADPNDAQASNNLAYLMVESGGDHDTALKLAQKAVDLNPSTPEFCDTLGWVLYRKGDLQFGDQILRTRQFAPPECDLEIPSRHGVRQGRRQAARTSSPRAASRVTTKVPKQRSPKKCWTRCDKGSDQTGSMDRRAGVRLACAFSLQLESRLVRERLPPASGRADKHQHHRGDQGPLTKRFALCSCQEDSVWDAKPLSAACRRA
jgi:tetratricopeptide (TPR) repeat protein